MRSDHLTSCLAIPAEKQQSAYQNSPFWKRRDKSTPHRARDFFPSISSENFFCCNSVTMVRQSPFTHATIHRKAVKAVILFFWTTCVDRRVLKYLCRTGWPAVMGKPSPSESNEGKKSSPTLSDQSWESNQRLLSNRKSRADRLFPGVPSASTVLVKTHWALCLKGA